MYTKQALYQLSYTSLLVFHILKVIFFLIILGFTINAMTYWNKIKINAHFIPDEWYNIIYLLSPLFMSLFCVYVSCLRVQGCNKILFLLKQLRKEQSEILYKMSYSHHTVCHFQSLPCCPKLMLPSCFPLFTSGALAVLHFLHVVINLCTTFLCSSSY